MGILLKILDVFDLISVAVGINVGIQGQRDVYNTLIPYHTNMLI